MKNLILIFLLGFVCNVYGQHPAKIGPSVLIGTGFSDDTVFPAFGLELSYEIWTFSRLSINVGGMAHYGVYPNEYGIDSVKIRNLFLGFEPSIRLHLQETYNGIYIGIGNDIRYSRAAYFNEPTIENPKPISRKWEVNTGFLIGSYYQMDSGFFINPNVFMGFNPFKEENRNFSGRIGCNILF